MQKKMLFIIGVIVILFVALYFVISYKNDKAMDDNPYDKEDLEQSTIDQLKDPLYGNQIDPDDLNTKIESGEAVTVYFYSPECIYCQRTTPILVPITEELDVDMKKLNLLEYKDQWGIESTPTLIHFDDGKEVARIVGQQPEEQFRDFFDKYVLP